MEIAQFSSGFHSPVGAFVSFRFPSRWKETGSKGTCVE